MNCSIKTGKRPDAISLASENTVPALIPLIHSSLIYQRCLVRELHWIHLRESRRCSVTVLSLWQNRYRIRVTQQQPLW